MLIRTLAIMFFFSSCSHRTDRESPLLHKDQLLDSYSSKETNELDEIPEDITEDIWALEESKEFCKDDIYGQYLREDYFRKNENRANRYRNPRSRNQYLIERDTAASHYARSYILGNTPDYFGDIPITVNPEVEYWMQFFKTRGRQTFLKWLIRAASISDVVEPLIRQEKLPKELFFLAMIESGFNFRAKSHASAMGPWQFMQGTGKLYGLKVSYWIDERNDPVKSTIAAANHLKDLYQQFGDWYLAMAAYNAGPAKIRRAMRLSKSTDFWSIAKTNHIRSETKHYVPKVLAAVILANSLETAGFRVKASEIEKFPSGFVSFDRAVSISDIAQHTGIKIQDIRKWNPELMRDIVPPQDRNQQNYRLRVPKELVAVVENKKEHFSYLAIRDVKLHKIRPGDTLYGIARKYNVNLSSIKSLNPDISATRLRPGRNVAVPVPEIVSLGKKSDRG